MSTPLAVGWRRQALLIAAFALAYGLLAIAPPMLRSWKTVVRLAGVRGALALALALALPASLPNRIVAIDATFAVVVVTILIGALTTERRIDAMEL